MQWELATSISEQEGVTGEKQMGLFVKDPSPLCNYDNISQQDKFEYDEVALISPTGFPTVSFGGANGSQGEGEARDHSIATTTRTVTQLAVAVSVYSVVVAVPGKVMTVIFVVGQ